jgi:transmembrane sensor
MSDAERIEICAADWLARRDGPVWDDVQQRELDAWLAQSIAHRVAYLRLASVWQRADRLSAMRQGAVSALAVQRDEPVARPGLARFSMQRIAAGMAIAVALGASWVGWHEVMERGEPGEGYTTAIGARETVALADGSHLILNTDTRLRAAVNDAGRMVWLDRGEAFFEVAHDPERPFVVLAGNRRITVLGTRFAVRRHADQVDVVVEEGRVQVELQTPSPHGVPTVVTRNQEVVSSGGNVLVVSKAAAQIGNELSWRQGKLVFDQMTLAEAAAEFNRYNRKKLIIADAALANVRIGGSFDTANIAGFAALLQQGFGLVVKDNGEDIRISN